MATATRSRVRRPAKPPAKITGRTADGYIKGGPFAAIADVQRDFLDGDAFYVTIAFREGETADKTPTAVAIEADLVQAEEAMLEINGIECERSQNPRGDFACICRLPEAALYFPKAVEAALATLCGCAGVKLIWDKANAAAAAKDEHVWKGGAK